MNEYDGKVELTTKEEVKSLKSFIDQIKNNNVNYNKINEIIKSKFPDAACVFYNYGRSIILYIDADYDEVYNEIMFTMILAKRYYTRINSNASKYWYTTNRGNIQTFSIDVNVHSGYNHKYKDHEYKTAIIYEFVDGIWHRDAYGSYELDSNNLPSEEPQVKEEPQNEEKLESKLVKEDFIIDLNDNLINLKGSIDSYVNSKGEIVREITFYTTGAIASVDSGLKFIVIKQDEDEEDYMYRFNGSIGKESLSYNRPIVTDDDIKKSIDLTIDMVSHSSVLEVYKTDLLEIKNSL